MMCRLLEARLDRRVHTLDDYWFARAPASSTCRSAGPSRSAGITTTSATICIARCSASASSTAAVTGRRPPTSTKRRKPSSTSSAASWIWRPACGCSTSAAAGARRSKYAAERYGVGGVGVTVSEQQVDARARDCAAGCRSRSACRITARSPASSTACSRSACSSTSGSRITGAIFEFARACLADDGLFLLHTIGSDESSRTIDPWIGKYIFPNSMLPSAAQIADASDGLFVIEDWHNFGADYDRTLHGLAGQRGAAPGRRSASATTSASAACGGTTWRPRWRPSARAARSSGRSCCRRADVRGGYVAPR